MYDSTFLYGLFVGFALGACSFPAGVLLARILGATNNSSVTNDPELDYIIRQCRHCGTIQRVYSSDTLQLNCQHCRRKVRVTRRDGTILVAGDRP